MPTGGWPAAAGRPENDRRVNGVLKAATAHAGYSNDAGQNKRADIHGAGTTGAGLVDDDSKAGFSLLASGKFAAQVPLDMGELF